MVTEGKFKILHETESEREEWRLRTGNVGGKLRDVYIIIQRAD